MMAKPKLPKLPRLNTPNIVNILPFTVDWVKDTKGERFAQLIHSEDTNSGYRSVPIPADNKIYYIENGNTIKNFSVASAECLWVQL